jgi:hypothetical protein
MGSFHLFFVEVVDYQLICVFLSFLGGKCRFQLKVVGIEFISATFRTRLLIVSCDLCVVVIFEFQLLFLFESGLEWSVLSYFLWKIVDSQLICVMLSFLSWKCCFSVESGRFEVEFMSVAFFVEGC